MLELNINCSSREEASVYLNAPNYHNLICDFYMAVQQAKKHGTDADVLFQVKHFFDDFAKATEHNLGAY